MKLFEAGQVVSAPEVWKGKSARASLGAALPIVVAVPAGAAKRLTTRVVRPDPLVAPIGKGQEVGRVVVELGSQKLAEWPLVAIDGVEESGFIGRAWDALRLWLK